MQPLKIDFFYIALPFAIPEFGFDTFEIDFKI